MIVVLANADKQKFTMQKETHFIPFCCNPGLETEINEQTPTWLEKRPLGHWNVQVITTPAVGH